MILAARPGPVQVHFWHLLAGLAFLVCSLGGMYLSERRQARVALRPAPPAVAVAPRAVLLPLVAMACAGAAAVHLVVMPQHFREATMYGGFFAVAAASQLGYATLLLLRPTRSLLGAGLAGNTAMLVLWLVSRTAGIPLGPAIGQTERFSALDILASGFEFAFVLGALLLLRPRWVLHPARLGTWAPAVWLVAPVLAAAVGVTALVAPPS